jgi:hypothetical protein
MQNIEDIEIEHYEECLDILYSRLKKQLNSYHSRWFCKFNNESIKHIKESSNGNLNEINILIDRIIEFGYLYHNYDKICTIHNKILNGVNL